jgi:glutathione reductase (NADPH)
MARSHKLQAHFYRACAAEAREALRRKGIDTFHGYARFTGPNTVELGEAGLFEARHIFIATGARPAPLGFPGEQYLIHNEAFLELEELPQRLVLVGGGYIAAEFSHIAARAGAKVTILQRAERMLSHFDPDLVDWLRRAFSVLGSTFEPGTR